MDGGLFILCSFFMALFNGVNRCVERVNFEDVNSCEVDSADHRQSSPFLSVFLTMMLI